MVSAPAETVGTAETAGTVLYNYDAENRLISVAPETPVDGATKVEYVYDYMSRRAQKKVSTFTSGSWSLTSTTTFIYDGWNLVKEQSTINNQPSTSYYVWGLDLSGSLQGAGGIGGLLARVKDGAAQQYTYGNGNVGQLINATDGSIAAHYEYDPYGNAIAGLGDNPFRFSTKYLDAETGLYYYGYRYYSPVLGRWLNRDPIQEQGGMNLYAFVNNSPTFRYDILGQWWDHVPFTESAVRANYSLLKINATCVGRMLNKLNSSNKGQDSYGLGGNLWDNYRHYNRDTKQSGEQGERIYQAYLKSEMKTFDDLLRKSNKKDCKSSLAALGRVSHSWQDFFIHAIRRDGKGAKFNSDYPGWEAWSVNITGTPEANYSFYPSSYVGEHPGGVNNEPIKSGNEEYDLRFNAAENFTTSKYKILLIEWITSCRCFCEASDPDGYEDWIYE